MNNDETTYVEGGAVQSSNNSWNDYDPDPFGWDSLPGSEHLPSKRGWTLPSGRSITAPFPGQEESYFRWSENKMAQHQRNIDALDAAYTVFMEGSHTQIDRVRSLQGSYPPAHINAPLFGKMRQYVPQQPRTLTPEQQSAMRRQALYNINNGMSAVTAGMIGMSRGASLGVPGMVAGGLFGAFNGYQASHAIQNNPINALDLASRYVPIGKAVDIGKDLSISAFNQYRENGHIDASQVLRDTAVNQTVGRGVKSILGDNLSPISALGTENILGDRINRGLKKIDEYLYQKGYITGY